MITKFNEYSGMFSVILDKKYYFKLQIKENPIEIYLILDNKKYQKVSIDIPDSKKLDKNEFFINPEIDNRIIDVLVNENFIEKTENESIAGESKTQSYRLII